MYRILVALDKPESREMIQFILESRLHAEAWPVIDFSKVAARLASGINYDLLIWDGSPKTRPIFEIATLGSKTFPVILTDPSPHHFDEDHPLVIGRSNIANGLESLVETVRNLIELPGSGFVPTQSSDKDFVRIFAPLLVSGAPFRSDVFIKLNENKYLKIFQSGDQFDQDDLERYHIKKDIHYFYLRNQDCGVFASKFEADLNRLLENPGTTDSELRDASTKIHAATQQLIQRIGVTPEVAALVKTQVKASVQLMAKSPNLKSILANIERDKDLYISSHSMALASIACSIATSMSWSSESSYQKLTYAALLHDVTLTNQELARFKSIEELEASNIKFTPEEIQTFKNHPIAGSDLIRSFTGAPSDVAQIIMEHHEQPDGTGFPRKIDGARMTPLGALFQFSHDLMDYLMLSPQNTLEAFLTENRHRLQIGQFKKILKALSKSSADAA